MKNKNKDLLTGLGDTDMAKEILNKNNKITSLEGVTKVGSSFDYSEVQLSSLGDTDMAKEILNKNNKITSLEGVTKVGSSFDYSEVQLSSLGDTDMAKEILNKNNKITSLEGVKGDELKPVVPIIKTESINNKKNIIDNIITSRGEKLKRKSFSKD